MAFGDDWTIDTTNKIVYNNGNSTTVYDINDFYSELVDLFDELSYMQYEVPIKAVTDYDYQMINGWFFDYGISVDSGDGHESHKFLENGSLTTLGWDADTYADGIRLLKFKSAGWVNFAVADIGGEVGYVGGTPSDTGTLLAFDNTKRWAWVRVDDTGDVFSNISTNIDIDDTTSHGQIEEASITGEWQWTCIFTIGTIEGVANANPMGQVYIFQDEDPVSEWQQANGERLTNWDRGNDHISVLILIKEADILKGEYPEAGYVYGYLREGGDVYSHFLVNLNAGGIQPLPLGTVNDLNQSTPDYYLLYDGEVGGGFTIGDIVVGGTGFAEGELASLTDWGTTGVLGLIGVSGTYADNEALNVSGTKRGDANGALGDVWFTYDDNTGTVAVGATLRNAGDTTRRKVTGKQDDTGSGKMTAQIDTTDTSNISKYYLPILTAITYNDGGGNSIDTTSAGTESVAAYADILIQFVNLELDYDGQTTNFTIGETVTGATSTASGIVVEDTDAGATGTLKIANWNGVGFDDNENMDGSIGGAGMAVVNGIGEVIHTMDKAFTLGTDEPYDVIIDMNRYDLADAYRHTMGKLYEYMKFVNRWDSAFSCYKVQERYLRGAVADDGGTQTDETSESRDTTAADMTLLPSGAVAIDDAYYFGQKVEFSKVVIDFAAAGDGTWVLTWEYWNGAWVAITDGIDDDEGTAGTAAGNFEPSTTGIHSIFWNKPADWTETTVKNIKGFWVRARVTTADAAPTTQPTGDQAWTWDVDTAETGEEYRSAFLGYAEIAVSPFGSYTGTALLGAQGIWAEGMISTETQAFTWTDSDGDANTPPNYQAISITNLVSGDKIGVFRLTGDGGDVDKDFYTSGVGNAQGDSDVVITEVPANDTPDDGYIVAVDVSESNREYSMRYTSWDQATKTFTLAVEVAGSVTTAGSPGATQLIDSAADFGGTEDVQEGDIVYNETDGSYAHIDEIVSTTELKTTRLRGGSDNEWDLSDTYSINTIPFALVSATDYLYVPFIYEVAAGASVSVTVIYTSDRDIGIFVRRTEETNPIQPFFVEGDFVSTGYSTACIRNDDNIVS